jgi:hypothetical protein
VRNALVATATLVALVTGCGLADLPDDAAFATCLDSAGVDPDDLGGVEERRTAFADPAALDCVADLPDGDDRRAALGDVYEDDDQVWPVLEDWIGTQDLGPEVLAERAGRLLAGTDGDDPEGEDADWADQQAKESLNVTVAVAALARRDGGLPASYERFLEDPQTPEADTDLPDLYTRFYGWTEDGDYDTWLTIEDLRSRVDAARES